MLKQSASRNQRYKGFKVKHVLQVCALLAFCIWLLNQVRNENGTEHGAIKLGRKDLDLHGRGSSAENKESAVEVEEGNKAEEIEDDGRGGGDDEIDGRDQEKVEGEEGEEVEDLIDEEDREKENQIEDLSLLEEHAMNEGEENLQYPRELYKSDDASSAVVQSNLNTGITAQIRRLRNVDEMVKNDEQRGKEIVSSFNSALSTVAIDLKVAKRRGGIPENTMEILASSTRNEKVSITAN